MPKKFSTVLLLSLSYVAVTQAQIKKKSTLIGGQIFYYTSNVDYSWNQSNQKEKDGAFNISIGRALKDNAVLGVAASYQPSTLNNFFNGSTFVNEKVNQYSFGVFYRQYKTLAKDFYFFAQPEADYITAKATIDDTLKNNLETIKVSGMQLTLMPGVSYKIFNKFYLEVTIPNIVTIQYVVRKDDTPSLHAKQKQFLFNTSLNGSGLDFLGVGFHFIF